MIKMFKTWVGIYSCNISKLSIIYSMGVYGIDILSFAGGKFCVVTERGVYRVVLKKPEGRRPLGRPRRRWVDNLGWISRRWDVGIWTGLGWPRIETGGGHLSVL